MSDILTILGSVGFNWHVALANFFNFLIILFLLNKFFFKKISKTVETRHNVIENGLNQAREGEKILLGAEEEKKALLKAAHKEHDTIVSEGEVLARDIVASLKKDAQEKIDLHVAQLDKKEAELAHTVEKSFREKAPHLVATLYAATLMKELTEEDNNKLIASMRA